MTGASVNSRLVCGLARPIPTPSLVNGDPMAAILAAVTILSLAITTQILVTQQLQAISQVLHTRQPYQRNSAMLQRESERKTSLLTERTAASATERSFQKKMGSWRSRLSLEPVPISLGRGVSMSGCRLVISVRLVGESFLF